ncbi:ead/Ea22-like family protein [Klebsiella pneumoniae]|uniref:ead/Ea22-like family protein n=1 Tax=Klebsiella pneumoniae TaxID=573 RepID=UPI00223E1D36|nr:ead/Ea22-like family protein [Klebsiella pneumoniae]MCX2986863.1 ead/Ea22-like family protein [Klebsiella pneumoniae]HCQ9145262.1 ead/Ea22-like family protein [Klebsiella pneumoniae]HCQ9176641.1 ead/Ea22-like family protein [Klebsiella pneumoniae]HCQ9185555.1 ead/Ea22-like family protein [Klebsiella pneumoniae]HCQ9410806.1 ead/Ea22-like family protein [Klebsiella pneumoniae]
MIDITKLTAEKLEEIRQRYRPTLAPKCHICGVEMTIQRMSASRITYGCAGAIYDETGCHYAEGRSLADDHYAESRITVVDVSDPDVLAMVEALEKAQQVEEELCKLLPPGVEYMDPPDGGDVTPLEGVRRMVADYRQRIAELESRTVKLPPKVDSSNIPFAGHTWNCCLDEVEKRLAAAGIKVEAE